MKLNFISTILLALVLISCAGTSKVNYTDSEMESFKSFIDSGDFQIISDWAIPLTTTSLNSIANAGLLPVGSNPSRINLIGNANYFRIKGDSAIAYLPYYGERQAGAAYGNSNTGISFKTKPEDLDIVLNEEKNRADIKFTARNDSEVFTVNAIIFPNLNSTITINSTQRFTISYQGTAKANLD